MKDNKEKYGKRLKLAPTSLQTTTISSNYNSRSNYLVSILSLVVSSCNIYWLSGTIQNCSIFETNNAIPDDIKTKVNTSVTTTNSTIKEQGKKPHEWNAIQYISGVFGHDDAFDTSVRNQCGNQSGYYSDASAYANYCFGPIHNALSCCYCYDKAYPTFVFEEAENENYDDATKLQWESHIPLLNLTNNENETLNINSYEKLNDFSRKSYYFCMKPRAKPIPTDEINITSLHDVLGDNKLVLATGKWGYNDTFKENVIESCDDIKGKSLFDNVHCHYNDNEPSFLPANDTRFERHMQYLYNQSDDSSRGGGYWFHKVVVMRYYMSIYNDNDYILWSDHDYVDRLEPLGLYKMVDTMLVRNADIILELLAGIEQDWTKEDMLHAFNASRDVRETYQVWAGFKLVRNTPKMREFYDALIECHANYHMLSDEPSVLPNHEDYNENRHDQSILSLFYKTFLSNQTVVGPPVQTYFFLHRFTFQLKEETNVYCPF